MGKTYCFEEIGSTIDYTNNGHVYLRYAKPGESIDQIRRQAVWIASTLDELAHAKGEPLEVCVDLSALHQINLDEESKETYSKILQQRYIAKVAIVGDAFSYTKLLNIFLIVTKHRGKVKFFFTEAEAKVWLGW